MHALSRIASFVVHRFTKASGTREIGRFFDRRHKEANPLAHEAREHLTPPRAPRAPAPSIPSQQRPRTSPTVGPRCIRPRDRSRQSIRCGFSLPSTPPPARQTRSRRVGAKPLLLRPSAARSRRNYWTHSSFNWTCVWLPPALFDWSRGGRAFPLTNGYTLWCSESGTPGYSIWTK